jgi:hypothetical protein
MSGKDDEDDDDDDDDDNVITITVCIERRKDIYKIVNISCEINIHIYSCNRSQQVTLFLKFILICNSTYFGQIYCSTSGVLNRHSTKIT